jgi:hypothetical protein
MGNIPTRILVVFVPNEAFNGSYTSNPFVFDHFDLNYLSININNQSLPIKALNLDFSNDQYILAYYLLLSGLGIAGKDHGIGIDREDLAILYLRLTSIKLKDSARVCSLLFCSHRTKIRKSVTQSHQRYCLLRTSSNNRD